MNKTLSLPHKSIVMKKTIFLTFLLLAVQAVAFGQADSCFTLFVQPTLLGYPYNGIFPITVENQTQGTTFTLEDSLLHNCDLTGVAEHDAARFSLSSCHPNPCEGKANVTLTTGHDGDVLLQLFDVQGRLKAASTVLLERGAHTVEVSLSGRGLHILRATSHGQSVYAKIVNLASSKANNAIRTSASVSIPQEGKGVQTQQNVRIGDKLTLRYTGHTLTLQTILDSVQSGAFVFNLRFNRGIWYRLLGSNDTLCWNQNSLKNKTVAIPLPYEYAFLKDFNAKHLIWKYLFFQDSTFVVMTNPECPLVDIPQIQETHFDNGFVRFENVSELYVCWPIADGSYKYKLSPYLADSSLVEDFLDIHTTDNDEAGMSEKPCHRGEYQLDIYTLNGNSVMQRFLVPRTKVFPKAFVMQKGHIPDDGGYGWDEVPPKMYLYILDNDEK